MGKYFVRDTPLAGLEREMMLPPNFAPRRSSSAKKPVPPNTCLVIICCLRSSANLYGYVGANPHIGQNPSASLSEVCQLRENERSGHRTGDQHRAF